VSAAALPGDALPVLASRPNLEVQDALGTEIQYLSFNTRDPILKDPRVRQAVAAQTPDTARRRADYVRAQQILARDLPAFNLWYLDTLVVHNRRLTHVEPSPSGSYTFLETAELVGD